MDFLHAGIVGRIAIVVWAGVLAYCLYCGWRLRAYRRPDVPAWKFRFRPQVAEPELYTAEGQPWLQRAGAAEAASIIGFWVVFALTMTGL